MNVLGASHLAPRAGSRARILTALMDYPHLAELDCRQNTAALAPTPLLPLSRQIIATFLRPALRVQPCNLFEGQDGVVRLEEFEEDVLFPWFPSLCF